jgi:hypothetical protein
VQKVDSDSTYFKNAPSGVEYEILEVNPPENDYFNHKKYYMPKYTFK